MNKLKLSQKLGHRWFDYFSSVVHIQTDRGHTVCQESPYLYVRHPGYMEFTKQTKYRLLPGV